MRSCRVGGLVCRDKCDTYFLPALADSLELAKIHGRGQCRIGAPSFSPNARSCEALS